MSVITKKAGVVLLAGLLFFCGCALAPSAKFLVVDVPVADIRKKPVDKEPGYCHDELQETQVLFNEVLLLKSERGAWYRVEALEQKKSVPGGKWQGYPGYIRKTSVRSVKAAPEYDSAVKAKFAEVYGALPPGGRSLFPLSLGTKLKTAGEQNGFYKIDIGSGRFGWVDGKCISGISPLKDTGVLRSDIMNTAGLFLQSPYLWGGRSFYMPFAADVSSGVDCSGLVNLAYRAQGIDLPRDAGDQRLMSVSVTADELKPADLIFVSAKNNFDRTVHVMLYAGGENIIESPETGKNVRVINFKDKFGLDIAELKKTDFVADNRKIRFGRIRELLHAVPYGD